jgi:hypothetical protein
MFSALLSPASCIEVGFSVFEVFELASMRLTTVITNHRINTKRISFHIGLLASLTEHDCNQA